MIAILNIFCRIVGEWKQKVDGTIMDLDNAQKETRNASSDLFKVINGECDVTINSCSNCHKTSFYFR